MIVPSICVCVLVRDNNGKPIFDCDLIDGSTVHTLQDSGDLATDFSVVKSKKSVSKSFSDGFATEKNSVGKKLLAKLSDGNLQSVAKFSD